MPYGMSQSGQSGQGGQEQEFERLAQEFPEFASLSQEFDDVDLGASADDLQLLEDIEREMREAGITPEAGAMGAMGGPGMDFSALAQSDPEAAMFIGNWIKNKVRKLIQQLAALARRYVRCAHCLRQLRELIALFRRGQYLKALHAAYKTFTCFRQCRQ